VGVVGEADEVGVKLFDPAEEGVDVGVGRDAAGAEGGFGVDADAVEGEGLAVEEDLGAASFDGSEADGVGEGVCARGEVDAVELGGVGGPEGEVGRGEGDGGAAVGVSGGGGVEVEFGDGD
jgi:hypothetical protein